MTLSVEPNISANLSKLQDLSVNDGKSENTTSASSVNRKEPRVLLLQYVGTMVHSWNNSFAPIFILSMASITDVADYQTLTLLSVLFVDTLVNGIGIYSATQKTNLSSHADTTFVPDVWMNTVITAKPGVVLAYVISSYRVKYRKTNLFQRNTINSSTF